MLDLGLYSVLEHHTLFGVRIINKNIWFVGGKMLLNNILMPSFILAILDFGCFDPINPNNGGDRADK